MSVKFHSKVFNVRYSEGISGLDSWLNSFLDEDLKETAYHHFDIIGYCHVGDEHLCVTVKVFDHARDKSLLEKTEYAPPKVADFTDKVWENL